MPKKVGIIGGTGFGELFNKSISGEAISLQTPYGEVNLQKFNYKDIEIYVLARHSSSGSSGADAKKPLPPHKVNYRGNIYTMKQLGIRCIYASCAVGAINRRLKVGGFGLITQFIDFTKLRAYTFYDDKIFHIDMSEPYCSRLHKYLLRASEELKIELMPSLVYVCTEGPRFETPAEIKMFERLGGDVVGMTNVPEVILAREAGICYSAVAVVTNYAAGINKRVSHEEVEAVMDKSTGKLHKLMLKAVELTEDLDCRCQHPPDVRL